MPKAKKFKNIARARRVPAASIKAGLVKDISGENKLEVVMNDGGDDAHMYLSGSVGSSWYDDSGITEAEVLSALDEIPKGKKIHAHINSEGGSVQEGLGIYNAFKTRSQDITSHIDGYACSIASVIPLAASKVISPKSAIWMIHQASCGSYGNATEMDKTTKMLQQHDQMLAEIYSEHTGKTAQACMDDMKAETWIRGSEAVEYGLADEGDEETENAFYQVPQAWIDRCKNIPANILNLLSAAQPTAGNNAVNQNTQNNMNKAIIVALLKAHGIEASETETEAQLQAKLEKIPKASATPSPAAVVAAPVQAVAVAGVSAEEFRAEKRRRIRAEVIRAGENRVPNDKIDTWVDRAMAATKEEDIFAEISALNPMEVGGDPVGFNHSVSVGNGPVLAGYAGRPFEAVAQVFKENTTPKARYDVMRRDWNQLLAAAQLKDGIRNGGHGPVFGANTYSATLTTAFLIMGATTKLSPKFAAIKAFSRDVSVDPYKPLATGVMKFTSTLQDGSTTQTNATNFENTNSEVDAVQITVAQYSNGGSVDNADYNSGIRMEDISNAMLMGLGSKIMQVVMAPVTVANFPDSTTIGPLVFALNPVSFGFAESRLAYAAVKFANTRNLILDTEYTAGLLNNPTYFQKSLEQQNGPGHWSNIFGWDNVFENTEWSAAGPNVHGLACDPQAVGVIAGLPLNNPQGIPGGILSVSTGVIPGAEMPIAVYMWFNTATRTYWLSFDSMVGASKLDGTAGKTIRSA